MKCSHAQPQPRIRTLELERLVSTRISDLGILVKHLPNADIIRRSEIRQNLSIEDIFRVTLLQSDDGIESLHAAILPTSLEQGPNTIRLEPADRNGLNFLRI